MRRNPLRWLATRPLVLAGTVAAAAAMGAAGLAMGGTGDAGEPLVSNDAGGTSAVYVMGTVQDEGGAAVSGAAVHIVVALDAGSQGADDLETTTTSGGGGFFSAQWDVDPIVKVDAVGATFQVNATASTDGAVLAGSASGPMQSFFSIEHLIAQLTSALGADTPLDWAEVLAGIGLSSIDSFDVVGSTNVVVTAAGATALEEALAELAAAEAELLALHGQLEANGCAGPFNAAIAAQLAAIQQARAANQVSQLNAATQATNALIARVRGQLVPALVLGAGVSGDPGQEVHVTATAHHICGDGNLLTVAIESSGAGPAGFGGGYPNYDVEVDIRHPRRAGSYPLAVSITESVLGQVTHAQTTVRVNDVAPVIDPAQGAAGLPGDRVQFTVAVSDGNAESAAEITSASVASEPLEDIDIRVRLAGPGRVRLAVGATVARPKKDRAYPMRVTVRDRGGHAVDSGQQFTVGNVLPSVTLHAMPAAVAPSTEVPQTVVISVAVADDNTAADVADVVVRASGAAAGEWIATPDAAGEVEVVLTVQAVTGAVLVEGWARDVDPDLPGPVATVMIPVVNIAPEIQICGFAYPDEPNPTAPGTPVTFQITAHDANLDALAAWVTLGGQEYALAPSTDTPGIFGVVIAAPAAGTYPVVFRVAEAATTDHLTVVKPCGELSVGQPHPPAGRK